MKNLSNIGRMFYGITIAVIGLETIYYKNFHPYLLPENHAWLPGLVVLAYVSGALLILAGACIVLKKKTRPAALLLGTVFLLIVCFYYIPYEFIATSKYMHLGEWENAEKELALAGGALIIAGCFPEENESSVTSFLGKLMPLGIIFFSLMMIGFGVLHFVYAQQVIDYVPSWVPSHLFWIYLGGVGLFGSGIGIILNIKRGLVATLLGSMIFIWFISLHMPRIIAAPSADLGDEVISAFLAIAYSGTAFVIAGCTKKKALRQI
ncbi:MAG: hypothetical protein ACXVAZ_14145 [Mucilaginibacter sp.]